MRIVVQRVSRAAVRVEGRRVAEIGKGLLLLVGVEKADGEAILDTLAEKVVHLRIFPDEAGKMNRSSLEEKTALLVVSQFTLAGSLERGRRPSFENAAPAEAALEMFEAFVERLRARGVPVATGLFGALMEVELVNEGPVTFVLEGDRR